MPHDVFISYSSKDESAARAVLAALEAAGIRGFLAPIDLRPGMEWDEALVRAIRQSSLVVLVLSPSSDGSCQVHNELHIANEEGVRILPCLLEEFRPSDAMRYRVGRLHWLSATPPPIEAHLGRITDATSRILKRIAEGLPQLEDALASSSGPGPFSSDRLHGLVHVRPRIPLRIPRPTPASQERAQHLQPHNRFLELVGREDDLKDLAVFRDGPATFQWKVFIGEGGVGKTRLCLEAAADSVQHGWHAGFLDASSLGSFVQHDSFPGWVPTRDTMVFVDYAASKVEPLKRLFERFAAVEEESERYGAGVERCRIRVVLVERHGALNRGWVEDLLGAGEMDVRDRIQSAIAEIREILPPGSRLPGGVQATRERILRATFDAWARSTGRPAPPFPQFGEDDWGRIQRNTGDRPLYLQMAAIHACETNDAASLPAWGRGEILKAAVDRERMYVRKVCDSRPDDRGLRPVLEQTTALLCLTGLGVTGRPAWLAALGEEIRLSGYTGLQPADVEAVRSVIFDLRGCDAEGGESTPIAPDLLAEAFTVSVLQTNGRAPRELLRRALELEGNVTRTRLIRLVQDLGGLGAFGRVSGWLDALVEGQPYEDLVSMAKALPERTLLLRDFALSLCRRALQLWSAERSSPAERAWLLIHLGLYLDEAGEKAGCEEALALTQEAVAIVESLAEGDPEGFEPLLGRAYHYLGRVHFSLGRNEECVEANLRAMSIRERLAQTGSDQHLADLGRTLNNLSNALAELKRDEEALVAAQRSAEIARQCAERNWHLYARDIGPSYNNLGKRLCAVGRAQEAIGPVEYSVKVRQELARDNPDAHGSGLLMSLENLITIRRSLGHDEEALRAAMEKVRMYEELALRHGSRYRAPLLEIARSFGREAYKSVHFAASVEFFRREVAVFRDVVRREPGEHDAEFAGSLHELGVVLSRLGRDQDALAYVIEALEIRTRLADVNFAERGEDLGWSHYEASWMLAAVGQTEQALAHREAARAAWARITEAGDLAAMARLAGQLVSVAKECGELGRLAEALDANDRALALHQALKERGSPMGRWTRLLAHNNRAYLLHLLGRNDEALEAMKVVERALDYLDSLERSEQLLLVGEFFDTFACIYRDGGRVEEARRAGAEALRAFEDLERGKDPNPGEHAEVFHTLGTIEVVAADRAAARERFERAVRHLRPHFLGDPTRYRRRMSGYWRAYLDACRAEGSEPDAALAGEFERGMERATD
jgi:tetratricopeptide (TPR) repeat protein